MGSMQMFLVIGGLVLISILIINFYSISGEQYKTKISNEAVITATGIVQSLIEEMARKSFDEQTNTSFILNKPDLLTLPASLGTDAGETNRLLFDDIDDYHNYKNPTKILYDSLKGLDKFYFNIQVYYAVKFNPDQKSSVRTFTKRAIIGIKNAFMKDTLKLSYIFTY